MQTMLSDFPPGKFLKKRDKQHLISGGWILGALAGPRSPPADARTHIHLYEQVDKKGASWSWMVVMDSNLLCCGASRSFFVHSLAIF